AWESEPAPSLNTCLMLGELPVIPGYQYEVLPPPGQVPPAPLVLAVGGLSYSDRPIAATRAASLTGLGALAYQSAAGDPMQALPKPHTGTSVGVTVAGAAAAGVWAYQPSRTAPAVIDLLRNTAQAIGPPVSPALCVGGLCAVQRLSLCDAVSA